MNQEKGSFMYNNSLLQNNGLKSPFENPFNKFSSDSDLVDAYKKLELLKQASPVVAMKNVFSDIADEWKSISTDERLFIENSKEYQEAFANYQNEFSAFLIDHLGNDFLKSPHGLAAEKLLGEIREKKESYKNKFASDITEIKEKNSQLEELNQELAKTNMQLQEQLKNIEARLN
jgi:vacuolar-type H+-ATPase subunit I/STV1